MNSNDKHAIRQLCDEFLRMYAALDDYPIDYFSETFSGFTCSNSALVKTREEWLAFTQQAFIQIKEPRRIELTELIIQPLAETVAVTTGLLTIAVANTEHALQPETARLVLVFRKEPSGWKISHSSISSANPLFNITKHLRSRR